jgi:hypothetical protein
MKKVLCRPPEGDDTLRLLTFTRDRFVSISSRVGLRGCLSELGAPGREGRPCEDETATAGDTRER